MGACLSGKVRIASELRYHNRIGRLKVFANTTSYRNLVARGALLGLKIIAIDSTNDTSRLEAESFDIQMTGL